MLSLAGSVVAWIVFGLAGQFAATFGLLAGLVTMFASRMVAGAMGENIAAVQAYVSDITPAERRARALYSHAVIPPPFLTNKRLIQLGLMTVDD